MASAVKNQKVFEQISFILRIHHREFNKLLFRNFDRACVARLFESGLDSIAGAARAAKLKMESKTQ